MRGRQILGSSLIACVLGLAAAVALAQPSPAPNACAAVMTACQQAGYRPGGASQGMGLLVDCIRPIMRGGQANRTGHALPQIDPQLVAACRAQNPDFGRRQAANVPIVTPQQVPPPPAVAPATRSERKPPNIVFILTDDLSWNLIQFMPHVLEMQKRGVSFSNYFVTDSLCCPSRSSIFTGRFPHNTGIFRNTGTDGGYVAFHNRGHEQATFAVPLAAAGYRMAMLGKYLNGYLPPQHSPAPGWSYWAVAGNGYPGFNYNLNQSGNVVHYGVQPSDYITDVLSGMAKTFIAQSGNRPFVIEVATFAPHMPYTPAPRDANAFAGLQAPRTAAFDAVPDANAPQWLKSHRALSQADIAGIDRDFRKRAQSVLAVDQMIGELQAAVAALGEADNTYFVFSSDNGYHMGEHRLMPGKMTAFDTDIRVPLIITGPGVPAGVMLDDIAENIDLCPTFTELAGLTPAPTIDGRSLVRLLHGEKVAGWRTVALVEHHGPVTDRTDPDLPGMRSGNPPSYEAMRSATSVYVEYANGEREYHDLTTDLDELHNTYASLPDETKASLHAALTALSTCQGAQACRAAETAGAHLTQR